MFGLREKFTYYECSDCGVLRLATAPHNLSDYYPKEYYSFAIANGPVGKLKPFVLSLGRLRLRRLIHSLLPMPAVDLIYKLDMTPEMKILDVGGVMANELKTCGTRVSIAHCLLTHSPHKKAHTAGR